jgi:hypothetical protein
LHKSAQNLINSTGILKWNPTINSGCRAVHTLLMGLR